MNHKILAISDIHGVVDRLNCIEGKEVDFLFTVGDLTNIGLEKDLRKILDKVNSFNLIKHKVIVLGNHDGKNIHNPFGMSDKEVYEWCRLNYPNIIFLDNEIVEIEGVRIYGTPYSERFNGWGFQYDLWEREEKTTPNEQVDIILSHEPHYSELGRVNETRIVGNMGLRNYIEKNKVDLMFVAHIHESGGKEEVINGCRCFNVANSLIEVEYKK